jgi:predicted DNA-binding transcriptional regulator YafY
MPAAKNTIKRYNIINQCLTSKARKYCSTESLLEAFLQEDIRVSARTLRYDIEAMRFDKVLNYNAPIEYCKINNGYYYTDPNYSITTLQLTEKQLKSIDIVVNSLVECQDLDIMHDFHGVIDKLTGIFKQVRNPKTLTYIEYEKAPYYKGIELRDPLIAAIHNKEALVIQYKTHDRSYPIKHIIHPYLLKEYDNSWYLVGLLHSKQKPMILAVDRMNSITTAEVDFLENIYFDPKEYFKNIIGITFTDGPVEEIILQVSPFLTNYLKAKHLHTSQQILKEDKAGATISLKLIINHELIQRILSYGHNMTVIKPEQLKQKVKDNLFASLKNYDV